jgi:hypothetical protein
VCVCVCLFVYVQVMVLKLGYYLLEGPPVSFLDFVCYRCVCVCVCVCAAGVDV